MARLFNGSTDKVLATIPDNSASDATFFAWIAPTVASGVILRTEISGGTGMSFSVAASFALSVSVNYDTINSDATSTTTISSTGWTLAVATHSVSSKVSRLYTGTRATAMAEVSYASQNTGSVAPASGINGIAIGNRTSATTPFTGGISMCGIAARVITLDEMEVLRAGRIPKNLLYLFPLTDASPSNDYELISGKNGTATGTTYRDDPFPIGLPYTENNYQTVRAGDGISVGEKIR